MPADPPPAWVTTRRWAIGSRIRDARLHAGLTQMQLAELVGVDHKTIHRIEYALSDPSLGLLLQIAHAVNVPLADLVR
ncbi:helix-turn-helix transcriptional regulator [Streptomyces thermolilacinus]|uniref:helix-turn-helix transcriptional regulator n=1 Tax=Streptomyces thermolilacinus TaxID=285540 RepID=UPI0033F0C908